jgi:predicted GNAT family acetyltransferase
VRSKDKDGLKSRYIFPDHGSSLSYLLNMASTAAASAVYHSTIKKQH